MIPIIGSPLPGPDLMLTARKRGHLERPPVQVSEALIVMTRLRVGDRAQNAHRKEPTQCKASNEDLTATRALHTLHGSCNAEASRCIISQVSPSMRLPMAASDSSPNMWPDSSRTMHE